MAGTIIDQSSGVSHRRAWNTWSQDRPAELAYLPLRVTLTPFAFSGKAERATLFPMSPSVRLGPRTIDADHLDMELEHGGTRLALGYRKANPFMVSGGWTVQHLDEWGARFWTGFILSSHGGEEWVWDEDTATALLSIGPRWIAVRCHPAPVLVTCHAAVEDVATELDASGYSFTGSRGEKGRALALRFSLEEAPGGSIVAAVGDDRATLVKSLEASMQGARPRDARAPAHTGRFDGALDAVRDTIAWNTVWDDVNGRRYTCLSRNWSNRKFNGFGVWCIDLLYHALMASVLDPDVTRENLSVVLSAATPQGNMACRTTGNDVWLDRGHPPLGAFVIWSSYMRLKDRSLLQTAFEPLRRNLEWWRRNRDPRGDGLLSFGSSLAGSGIYKGTKFAAKNESSMDNSPVHDELMFDEAARTLDGFDVGLNSLFALEAEMLSRIALELGMTAEGEALSKLAEEQRARIRTELWDDDRKIFANRKWSGEFTSALAPTSFYPLLAGAADERQIEHLLSALSDEALFGGAVGLPSVQRSHPSYRENVYWRGPVWAPLNFLVWQGLRRNGLFAQSAELAERSYALFMDAWRNHRAVPENYDAETGWRPGRSDTDWFYSWGALMPAMAVAELAGVDPWNGWTVCNEGDYELGPHLTAAGQVSIRSASGIIEVARGEAVLLRTDVRGRITQLGFAEGFFSAMVPASDRAGWMEFPVHGGRAVVHASVDGRVLDIRPLAERLPPRIEIPPAASPRRVAVVFG